MKKDTVGKLSSELIVKSSDNTHSAEEQMREQLSEYDANLYETMISGKKLYPSDFYIVVITKKERLMPNVIRHYFLSRSTCPTPEFDQTVYRYNKKEDYIDFLWVIPSKDTCEYLKQNALVTPKEERQLLEYVLLFYDQTLFRVAKKLNGEEESSPFIM